MEANRTITLTELARWTIDARDFLAKWESDPLSDMETIRWIDRHDSKLNNRPVEGDIYTDEFWLVTPADDPIREQFSLARSDLSRLAFTIHKRMRSRSDDLGLETKRCRPLRILPESLDHQP
ncbi:hypothetical protein N9N28_03650 [Rubripirellula amarantea]|nr:hypothetical protein [Rubripirellula amarantea]